MKHGERVLEFVNYVYKNFGTRLAGSEGEMRTGEYIHEIMSEFCDEVEKEVFTSRPRGFTDYIWITALLYALAVISYFIGFWFMTFVLILLGFALFIFQQCLHYEVIDILFPKVQEFHVIGKIKPRERVEKTILLSAHHDSP